MKADKGHQPFTPPQERRPPLGLGRPRPGVYQKSRLSGHLTEHRSQIEILLVRALTSKTLELTLYDGNRTRHAIALSRGIAENSAPSRPRRWAQPHHGLLGCTASPIAFHSQITSQKNPDQSKQFGFRLPAVQPYCGA